ncbi:MAG: type IV pilus biogenesis/stability protein PilW [Gemmatimonadota bacterium]
MPRWALAGVLYKSGHLEESQRMFEELHAEDPTMYSFQSYLGMLAARLGERAEAGRFDAMLAADGPSWNVYDAASRIYWRGCIAALLGERERAVSLLREALAAGLPWTLDSIHGGPDLEPLRDYQPYRELVRLKG